MEKCLFFNNTLQYHDIETNAKENTNYFFLENVLKARISLHLETGRNSNDAEVNVYLAGLLMALVTSDHFVQSKPYISSYDFDVRHYLDEHPGRANEYTVYKDNADFGLMSTSVFSGYQHAGSYHDRIFGDTDDSIRVALYYELAASALCHIQGPRAPLAETFGSLSKHIDETIQITRTVAGDYFGFIEHFSEGSLYHLGRELTIKLRHEEFKRKIDDFLKLFADFKKDPTREKKQAVCAMARELKSLNPKFGFDEKNVVSEINNQVDK